MFIDFKNSVKEQAVLIIIIAIQDPLIKPCGVTMLWTTENYLTALIFLGKTDTALAIRNTNY